ncbi:hypothetical protein N9P30_02300 [Alphaproteobacteria bacterium]|nr:hypothetical protein [Alphaproteobacteria bacterium]
MLIRRRLIQANLLGALFLIGWILLYQLLLADDVTLKAIAEALGISVPSVYKYRKAA